MGERILLLECGKEEEGGLVPSERTLSGQPVVLTFSLSCDLMHFCPVGGVAHTHTQLSLLSGLLLSLLTWESLLPGPGKSWVEKQQRLSTDVLNTWFPLKFFKRPIWLQSREP